MPAKITKSLVFVVGAGASLDFGKSMPIGPELALRVEAALNEEFRPDPSGLGPIKRALKRSTVGLRPEHHDAADAIRDSLGFSSSIDNLLNGWTDVPETALVAKLAIADQILRGEHDSDIGATGYADNETARRRIAALKDNWLHYIVRHIGGTRHERNVEDNFRDVAFIVFNYDRCIEQYLYWAFQMAGGLTPARAAKAVRAIPIVHAYGQLGSLPYDQPNRRAVAFGAKDRLSVSIANQIRTYTEEARDQKLLRSIQTLAIGADKIVFLGFAYHRQNLDLLFPKGIGPIDCKVWGTAMHVSAPTMQTVQQIFRGTSSNPGARLEETAGCTTLLSRFHDQIFAPINA